MTTCLGIRNATHWADTHSIGRISCSVSFCILLPNVTFNSYDIAFFKMSATESQIYFRFRVYSQLFRFGLQKSHLSVHSFSTQCNTEHLPSYLQTNIIAQMLSIGGDRVIGMTDPEQRLFWLEATSLASLPSSTFK